MNAVLKASIDRLSRKELLSRQYISEARSDLVRLYSDIRSMESDIKELNRILDH